MRVNVYAEEMTDRIEIITKTIDGNNFTGLRIYLELPVAYVPMIDGGVRPAAPVDREVFHLKGPFIHRPGDDDSSAVTFWGKSDLRVVLRKALAELDAHYAARTGGSAADMTDAKPATDAQIAISRAQLAEWEPDSFDCENSFASMLIARIETERERVAVLEAALQGLVTAFDSHIYLTRNIDVSARTLTQARAALKEPSNG